MGEGEATDDFNLSFEGNDNFDFSI